jgi:hypothetical protein
VEDLRAEVVRAGVLAAGCEVVSLNRVDVDRDFRNCENGPGFIASLSGVAPPGELRMVPRCWKDKHRHRAATLTIGNSKAAATLYDKSTEAGLAPGHLRYEARLRRDYLRRHGVEVLSDLPATLGIAKDLFDVLGWDAVMAPLDAVIAQLTFGELVYQGRPLSNTLRAGLISHLAQRRAGIDSLRSEKTVRRYERILHAAGINCDASPAGELWPAVRLDWEAGTLRRAA